MSSTIKTVVFWLVILVAALLLWQNVRSASRGGESPEITYSDFMSNVDAGKVAGVTITGAQIRGNYRETGGQFHLIGPSNQAVYLDHLREKGVEIRFRDSANGSTGMQLLGTWAPLLLLGVLWIFMIRRMQSRNRQVTARRPESAPIEPK